MRDTLEDEILNGSYEPGEQLDVESLASRFKVSRTPVREALQQLASSGLVSVIPRRGTFVAQIGIVELVERFEVMAELEGMCGRLAARRIRAEEVEALTAALQRCEEASARGACDDYYYENATFHSCIYDASHNHFLAAEATRLRNRLKPYRRLQLRVPDRISRSQEEHRRIYDAIVGGDGARAERLLKEHVVVQGERFSDLAAAVERAPAAHDAAPSPAEL